MGIRKDKGFNLWVDCTHIWNNYTGLAVYTISLLKGFKLYYPEIRVTTLLYEDSPYEEFERLVGHPLDIVLIPHTPNVKPTFLSHKLDRIRGRVFFEKLLEDRQIDRVLTPFLSWLPFVYPRKYRQCAIIHDLKPIEVARMTSRLEACKVSWWLKFLVRKIPFLITISAEIQRQVKTFANRETTLVYNSLSLRDDLEPVPLERVEGKRYILCVNRFHRYKNAETLIRAFNKIKEGIPHMLYLKGSDNPLEDYLYLRDLVKCLGLDDRVIVDTEDRSQEQMAYLYKHAEMFVSPSRLEGFGYTPIEAAIYQVPVLVSDIGTFRDVTRGKFQMFNPDSADELAEMILATLESPPSKEELAAIAAFFKQEYSLERQMRQIVSLLEKE